MKIVVLSSEKQYSALIEAGINMRGLTVICDNPRLRGFLKNNNIDSFLLDEFLIPEEQRKNINAWGCDKAAEWIRVSREERFFKEFDFASSVFLRFGYILVQMLKNFYYAGHIIDKYKPDAVIVFDFLGRPTYPSFSGNIFLNDFLTELCKQNKINVERITVSFERDKLLRNFLSWRFILISNVKETIRKAFNFLYGKFVPAKKDTFILAWGALKHLAPVILKAHKKGIKIALYDTEFRLKSFKFARRNKIPYFISECFPKNKLIEPDDFVKKCVKEISVALDYACLHKLFVFSSYDFGDIVKNIIFSNIQEYCCKLSEHANHYANILNLCKNVAFILDEDTSHHSFLAAFFNAKGKKIFCISHATMPINFSVSDNNRVFGLSTTFVNSEFEKVTYEMRGWDQHKIVVTGIPRFDRLAEIRQQQIQETSRNIKLLYCGASMKLYWPERGGYLGLHITNYGDAQKKALRLIFGVIKEYPIELVLKPHNFEGKAWHRFIKEENPYNKVTLMDNTYDFFNLLDQCDAMILAHWSTALIEAALCNKHTILLDFFNSEDLAPYAKVGSCVIVRNEIELRREMEILCKDFRFTLSYTEKEFESVFGKKDGFNTQRVVDCIERIISENSHNSL
jgi:hypothetical protein